MRIGSLLFGFIIIFTSCQAQLPKDKQNHLVCGSAIGFWASSATINKPIINSFCWSVGSTVVIGGSKELIYDKWMGKGTPEWKDLGWTVIGGVTGWGIVIGFKVMFNKIDHRKNKKYAIINSNRTNTP